MTEIVKMPAAATRSTIDHGWRDVADTALEFVQRFVKPWTRHASTQSGAGSPRCRRADGRGCASKRAASRMCASICVHAGFEPDVGGDRGELRVVAGLHQPVHVVDHVAVDAGVSGCALLRSWRQ